MNALQKPTPYLLLIALIFTMIACVKSGDPVYTAVRTDIKVHVTVNDSLTNAPVSNQTVSWRIHMFNGANNTESDIKTGTVTTGQNGTADLPVYETLINAGNIARILAYIPEQANANPVPLTVTYQQCLDAADTDNFAVIEVDFPILK